MAESEKSDERSLKDTLKAFAQDTTCHGIGGIVRTKHTVVKILWSLLFIAAMGTILFQVSELFRLYTLHKLKTHISDAPQGFTEFPSVTICNRNPISKSALEEADGAQFKLLKSKYQAMNSFDEKVTTSLTSPNQTISMTGDFYQYLEEYREQVGNIWYSGLSLLGQNKETFIQRCIFRGKTCDASNFSLQISPVYGNCYTFNSNELLDHSLGIWRAGSLGGLELVLNIELHEYVPYVSDGYGVRLTIHEFGTFAFVQTGGISVSPGIRTHTHLNLVNMKRHPWFCTYRDGFEEEYSKKYTTMTCELEVFDKLVFEECRCQLAVMEIPLKRQGNVAFCNETKEGKYSPS
ncbi:amiloride-sensitive sodium channel subunit gamma-like [Lineus longissimus]|uniref:amiloride-sensitive sodium channel subunit gamma-like n=1 Tax=Lineus longissimus TaxID=88925 RepID=UPI00315CAF07